MDDSEILKKINAIWKQSGGSGSASFVSTLLKFNRDNTDIEFFNNETAFYAATLCKEHATLYFIATLSKGRGEGRAMFRFLCEKCRKLGKKRIRLKREARMRDNGF